MNCTRKGYRGFPVSRVSAFNHVYVANQNNTLCIHEVIPTFPAETASHRLLSGDSILPNRLKMKYISRTRIWRSYTQGNMV